MEGQYDKPYGENYYPNNKESNNDVSSNSTIRDNNNQLIIKRNHIAEQICAIQQKFKEDLDKIEDDFIRSYKTYSHEFINVLNNFDEKVEKNIESEQLKSDYYSKMYYSLTFMLEKKMNDYKEYITGVVKIIQNFLDKSIADDFSSIDPFINNLIQIQKDKKQKEEDKKKNNNNKQKRIKMEICGDTITNPNNEAPSIFDKLVIKKMTREGMESLFPQISENRNDSNNGVTVGIPDRTQSNFSISGEPAPMSASVSNKVKFSEGVNYVKNKGKIIELSIHDSTLEDIDFQKNFHNLEVLKFKNTKLSFNIADKIKFDKLDTLKLENVGLINENFNILFEQLRKNEIMRKNLRVFSVKNNNISFLDYKKGYADNILKTMTFTNLEILDMSYNRLYLFQNQIFNCLDSIKLIDLTNNNIVFPTNLTDLYKSAKLKKCLVFMSNNLAILKEKSNREYNKYLIEILPKITYPIKNITLDNIFVNYYNDIFQLDIGKYRDSLVYLNLSNGLLKDDNLISLFKDKWDFRHLKSLILESNKLTENFLYAIINKDNNLDTKFSVLKVLNLSDNQIHCPNVDKFGQFLEALKNLVTLELKCTPIEQCINQFYRKKVMKYHDTDKKKISHWTLNENEEKISQIFEKNIIKDKSRATLIINDLIGSKYTKTLFTHLKNLVESINLKQ